VKLPLAVSTSDILVGGFKIVSGTVHPVLLVRIFDTVTVALAAFGLDNLTFKQN